MSAVSFTSNFRARNQELFIDTRWIDLDDLKSWLPAKQLSFYLVEDQSAGSLMSSSEPPFLDQSASSWYSELGKTKRARAGNAKIQELRSQLAIFVAEQSSSGVVRVRQKNKSSGLSATLKGKGHVRESAKSKGKQRQRTEEEIDPDDDDIDTNVFEGMNKFLEALHDHLFRLAGPDPTLSIESNPPQFSEPQDLNSGVTVESGAMESEGDPAPAGLVQVGTSFNATPPSSRALASVHVPPPADPHGSAQPPLLIQTPLQARLFRLNRQASLLLLRIREKPWGVVHDNQTYTSFEFLAQFPDEYRSLYGDAEPA
ncbi:hypothetical protein B0H13DRAFT_2374866 [Mycena leptocephala]|nr:hypothetical protein B0H13DRAFT_2374866 [Mycena leptocephala]